MKARTWPALLVLGLALVLVLLYRGGAQREWPAGSVRSTKDDGRRALYVWLERLGHRVSIWERPPGALPRDQSWLWLPRSPYGAEEPELVRGRWSRMGEQHRPSAYREFVEQGGTLLLANGPGVVAFLSHDLGWTASSLLPSGEPSAPVLQEIELPSGEKLELALAAQDELSLLAQQETAWRARDGRVLVCEYELGEGRVLLLCDDQLVANLALLSADGAIFLQRLLEHYACQAPLVFDEYVLSGWPQASPLGIAFGPKLAVLCLPLLVYLVLAGWRSAWLREFPRDPAIHEALSPLARARALASLYLRAGRGDLLRDQWVQLALRLRLQQLQLSAPSAEDDPSADALAQICSRLACSSEQARLSADLRCSIRTEVDFERVRTALRELEQRSASGVLQQPLRLA